MRLKQLRISGFRAVAHTATFTTLSDVPQTESDTAPRPAATSAKAAHTLEWARGAFTVNLPASSDPAAHSPHLMSAIMGANSAGKSTILLALQYFLGNTGKLDPAYFHEQDTHRPIIMEATLSGPVSAAVSADSAWCERFVRRGPGGAGEISLLSIWTKESRQRWIRANDGHYYKQTPGDRAICERLLPAFRMIGADTRPGEAAELKRDSLLSDLVTRAFQPRGNQHVARRIQELLHALETLLTRRTDREPSSHTADDTGSDQPHTVDWSALDALEQNLSVGLAQLTPQQNRVRIRLDAGLPRLEDILARGLTVIDDGAVLPFEQHGLGLQRAFAVSVLRAWCDQMADTTRDYLFAIEEPEIYLHPHATRTLLRILEQIAQQHQVVFTTHANEFVNRAPLQHILMVTRRRHNCSWVSHVQSPQLRKLKADDLVKVQRYLREDRSDMLFARAVLLVEGQAELFALPSFASTLGLDLDAAGVSVVFVNGIGNFGVYHQILSGFGIPHTVLMDGDGKRAERERAYAHAAHRVIILDHDFERTLVDALTPERRQALARECQQRRGKPGRPHIGSGRRGAEDLASLGKPLVGRVAGELCTADEIRRMPELVQALEQTIGLATAGTPMPD